MEDKKVEVHFTSADGEIITFVASAYCCEFGFPYPGESSSMVFTASIPISVDDYRKIIHYLYP